MAKGKYYYNAKLMKNASISKISKASQCDSLQKHKSIELWDAFTFGCTHN
jgi:hypothetical protein